MNPTTFPGVPLVIWRDAVLVPLLVGVLWVGTGCGSTRSQSEARRAAAAYWSDAAVEDRVRGYAHYAAGVLAELESDGPAALDHFVEAARRDPLHEPLVLQVTARLLQNRRSGDAVDLLTKCVQSPKAPASYHAWLGLAQVQRGDMTAAIQANRAALDRAPTFMLAYQNLVAILSEQRRFDEALAVIREAARQTSLDPTYHTEVAELLVGHARMHPETADDLKPETLAALSRAAALNPANPFLVHRLAEAYKRLGDLEAAEEMYRALLKQAPNALLARESLVDLYLRMDNRPQATELLQQLVREQPGNERAAYVLGSLAFQDGRLEEAEGLLSKAIILEPRLQPAYYELAAVRLSLRRHEDALEVLDRARAVFPQKTFVGEFYSALAHVRAERYDQAVRHFTEAELLAGVEDPSRLTHLFYFQFGAASERRGDYETAAFQFRKCLELAPDFAEALNYLGYMWAERGENLEEAKAMIERAVQMEPDNAAFLDSLGWVLFQLGQPQDALPWIEEAIEKSEEPDPTLLDHLGDILHALGRLDEARVAWEKAIALQPDGRIELKLRDLEKAAGAAGGTLEKSDQRGGASDPGPGGGLPGSVRE
jgi:tetratricopeptide (TPR) repeat protein